MKKLLVITLLCFVFNLVKGQEIFCADSLYLRRQLSDIRKQDQDIRAKLIREMAGKTPEEIKAFALEMRIIDQKNQSFIALLLDKCGWPKGLSSIENNTIFLVIDHADITFMTKYYPLLENQMMLGVVSKEDFATLHDRIQLRSGKKQKYGTQTFKVDQLVTVWPIEDQENIDLRRAAMALPTMKVYIELLEKTYKAKVIWDKSLTVEEANTKMIRKK